MCPLVQPTCSHYFSNFYPLFDPKPNYIIQNTMIYHRFPLKIFFVLFLSRKKIKEFRYGKNAKHVKVNFVDDVLAIDLKKIEGMIEENMTKMRPSSMKNHDVCM